MLATLVIGLREGLEAALIVGIIAAFLRNNGKSLVPMWCGVVLAIGLSIAVGVALNLVEAALPQARQEAMESIIGAVAIVFVTSMIVWMNTHARDMKRQLEAEAAEALGRASAWALASMAFLAVLKEGFETSVFLLATFSAAQSAGLAAAGAVIGLAAAAVIGWGIYAGGVRLNLGRFFRVTGTFLILVAAGLVITSLRTAHEAGWLNAGQQPLFDLSWLVAPGTVQSALITGVLGIPADPRLIEVIGWLCYLVPVTLYIYWPARHRPHATTARRLQLGSAGVAAAAALALFLCYPAASLHLPSRVPLTGADGSTGWLSLTGNAGQPSHLLIQTKAGQQTLALSNAKTGPDRHQGAATTRWQFRPNDTAALPSRLTLDRVVALNDGRLPIGLNRARQPGPFAAHWHVYGGLNVWVVNHTVVDAASDAGAAIRLTGGGLSVPRTISATGLPEAAFGDWRVAPAYRTAADAALLHYRQAESARVFWTRQLPTVLLAAALVLLVFGLRRRYRDRRPQRPIARSTSSSVSNRKDALHAPT